MKKWMLLLLALAMLFAAGCGEGAQKPATQVTAEPTTEATEPPTTEPIEVTTPDGLQVAPGFTVYTADGEPVKLRSFRGKPVVLNFWASSCPPCRSEMDAFQMAYDYYGEDFTFVMVNLTDGQWDTLESATAYITQEDYTFPVYFDTSLAAVTAYQITAIPATFFIDENGGAVAWHSGAMDYNTLEWGLKILSGEESIPTQPAIASATE